MPLIEKLKVPGAVMMVNSFLVSIATFDLIPTEKIDSLLFYIPEEDSLNMHF